MFTAKVPDGVIISDGVELLEGATATVIVDDLAANKYECGDRDSV